jgi:hypothetical protein
MCFVNWLNNLHTEAEDIWMFAGDLNFYRSVTYRNKDGGNMHDIMIFNEIISNLGLLEIALEGRGPFLEQID